MFQPSLEVRKRQILSVSDLIIQGKMNKSSRGQKRANEVSAEVETAAKKMMVSSGESLSKDGNCHDSNAKSQIIEDMIGALKELPRDQAAIQIMMGKKLNVNQSMSTCMTRFNKSFSLLL